MHNTRTESITVSQQQIAEESVPHWNLTGEGGSEPGYTFDLSRLHSVAVIVKSVPHLNFFLFLQIKNCIAKASSEQSQELFH